MELQKSPALQKAEFNDDLDARADAIVTGDGDLLALHPFRRIPVLSPRQFLTYELEG